MRIVDVLKSKRNRLASDVRRLCNVLAVTPRFPVYGISSFTRHRRLLCLVERLQASCYPDTAPSAGLADGDSDTATTADKRYYLNTCRLVCNDSIISPSLCVSLLGNDPYTTLALANA